MPSKVIPIPTKIRQNTNCAVQRQIPTLPELKDMLKTQLEQNEGINDIRQNYREHLAPYKYPVLGSHFYELFCCK